MDNPLENLQGIYFVVIEPFLVADLDDNAPITDLEARYGRYGMEPVPVGSVTVPHKHPFLSLYHAHDLDVVREDETRCRLPVDALVLVPPYVQHSWKPKQADVAGAVGSLDRRHERQELRELRMA